MHIANCPHCRGSLLIDSADDPSLCLRCPSCSALFEVAEVSADCVAAPPRALAATDEFEIQSAGAEAGSELSNQPAEPVSPAAHGMTNGYAGHGDDLSSSPNEAWYASLSASEGSSPLVGDFDVGGGVRPDHREPEFNPHLSVAAETVVDAVGCLTPAGIAGLESSGGAEVSAGTATIEAPAEELEVPGEAHDWPAHEPALAEPETEPKPWEAETPVASPEMQPVGAIAEPDPWGNFDQPGTATLEPGEMVGEYALAEAATGGAFAEPGEAYRSPPAARRRKAQPSSMGMIIQMGGIVGGGIVGLLLGYIILLWIGGRQKDFLKIADKLPGFMVPSDGTSDIEPISNDPINLQDWRKKLDPNSK